MKGSLPIDAPRDPMDEFVLIESSYWPGSAEPRETLTLHLRGAAASADLTIERSFDSGVVLLQHCHGGDER